MERALSFIGQHRRIVTAVLIAISVLAAGLSSQVRINNALDVWFPEEDPELVRYRQFAREFGGDEVVVSLIHGGSHKVSVDWLRRIDTLTRELESVAGVDSVMSPSNVVVADDVNGALTTGPMMTAPVDASDVARLERSISSGTLPSRLVRGGGSSVLVYTWLKTTPDIDQQRGPILDEVRARFDNAIRDTGATVSHGGIGVVYDALNRATLGEGAMFISFSYVIVIAALWWLTRRLRWVLVALGVITVADLIMFSAMALQGSAANMVTMALPALVMVLGVANVLHLAVATGHQSRTLLSTSFVAVAGACVFNMATEAGGFLALTTASMKVTRDFGLHAAIGVSAAGLLAIIVVMVCLPWLRERPLAHMHRLQDFTERIGTAALRRPRVVIALSALAVLVSLAGMQRIVADTYSIGMLDGSHSARKDSDVIEHHAGPYVPVELTVTTPPGTQWFDAAVLSAIERASKSIERPATGKALSALDVLRDLRAALEEQRVSTGWVPATTAEAAELVNLVEIAGKTSPWKGLVSDDGRTLRVTLPVRMQSARGFVAAGEAAVASMRTELAGIATAEWTGYLPLYGQMVRHVVDDQLRSFFWAFLIVFILVAMMVRSGRLTLAAMPSNVLPVLCVLGIMGFAEILLDIATVTIASAVMGILVDDTVHLLMELRTCEAEGLNVHEAVRRVMRSSGAALVSTSLVLASGFVVMALSSVKSVAFVGLLTAVAIVLAMVADLVLLPVMASYLWRRAAVERAPVSHDEPAREVIAVRG